MIKAFIFDLDGVIVDTAKYHYNSWRRLCNEVLDTDLSIEENEHLKGISRIDSLKWILDCKGIKASSEDIQNWASLKNEWYLEQLQEMESDEILPGVKSFIESARKESYQIALGSSSKNADLVLDLLDLTNLFDTILGGNDIHFSKPHPEIFIRASERLHLLGTSCIVFEDAEKGIEAALHAGCKVIGVGLKENLPNAPNLIKGFEGFTPNEAVQLVKNTVIES